MKVLKKFCCMCLLLLLVFTGCGKKDVTNVVDSFKDTVNKSKSYVLKGTMEIYSDEDTFTYSLEANFLKDNFYKVRLVNQTNNHEQIILRNNDGIYVISPSLNKSFKFQSEWPDNSSQSYLLKSLVNDIEKDPEVSLEEIDGQFVIKAKVNYPNNPDLKYQKITLDKDYNIEKVEVFNESDIVKIKVNFSSVDLKSNLSEDHFKLSDYVKEDNQTTNSCVGNDSDCEEEKNNCEGSDCKTEEEKEETTGSIQDIIYPLFIPSNTYLSSSDKILTDNGERVILTFGGEKNFVLVEEIASVSKEFEIIPVYGDPLMLNDTIGALSANSLTWTSNNITYYLTGTDLSSNELLKIAKSLGATVSVNAEK